MMRHENVFLMISILFWWAFMSGDSYRYTVLEEENIITNTPILLIISLIGFGRKEERKRSCCCCKNGACLSTSSAVFHLEEDSEWVSKLILLGFFLIFLWYSTMMLWCYGFCVFYVYTRDHRRRHFIIRLGITERIFEVCFFKILESN